MVYPLLGISANVALVMAGNYMKYVNKTLAQVCQQGTICCVDAWQMFNGDT